VWTGGCIEPLGSHKKLKEMGKAEMRNRTVFCLLSCLLFLAVSSVPVAAQSRVIVRDSLGHGALQTTCFLLRCSIIEGIDGSLGQVFLVAAPTNISLTTFLGELVGQLGIVDAEPDLLLHVMQTQTAPSGLYDTAPVDYYGTTVWDGYANQPASQIINLQAAQQSFNVSGAGIVAVPESMLMNHCSVARKITGLWQRQQCG